MCSVSSCVGMMSCHLGLWENLRLAERKGRSTGNDMAQSFLADLRREAVFHFHFVQITDKNNLPNGLALLSLATLRNTHSCTSC